MKPTRRYLVKRRHKRLRKKVSGTSNRPRLAVFRSSQHIYAQAIDDTQSHTLAAASTLDGELKTQLSSCSTCEASAAVGKLVAERLIAKGIQQVIFDRGGNLYHGRVRALAEAAREAGLDF
ncbi:50S ribosomal protein L18 [Lusitaniella coriacea LEGE 07157]|uniref:Large ribosomal subunit protein uL18 n=1 Tax=Lusitaniella coriacea LEGE 07157 TaxID=945747 RepID=A0A8J7DXH4_9CYAN|nr:50S ribosomal protein L18 [Lusitaniella coriacea]MBE9115796.1 50S ribosomal protein L18 [Lusitaniella coriacea LEGE 07157]